MKLVFSERAWAQYSEWQGDDGRTLVKINELIRDCLRDPFRRLGKPEPLSGNLSGWWSRRITGEHRLVYRMSGVGEAKALGVAGACVIIEAGRRRCYTRIAGGRDAGSQVER